MMGYTSGWIFMFIGGLIVIGIIVLIIYALVRAANTSGSSASHEVPYDSTSRALTILAERYAKGEISDEEYKQKKSEIMKL